jgi:hypothetical protein
LRQGTRCKDHGKNPFCVYFACAMIVSEIGIDAVFSRIGCWCLSEHRMIERDVIISNSKCHRQDMVQTSGPVMYLAFLPDFRHTLHKLR